MALLASRPTGHPEDMERSIEASTIIGVPSDQVGRLLVNDPSVALPTSTTIGVGGVHRDLVVTVDDSFATDDSVVVPIAWHAAEHQRLFPIFLGELVAEMSVAGTRLTMIGSYSIPFGLAGRFGDGLLGRRVAHGALRGVLIGVAERLEAVFDAGDPTGGRDVSITELPSEVFIG